MLKLARVRFLLADDAGAGKTIMAGLLIRELELRGRAERILIVCPANLAFQWQRELKEKFEEKFLVFRGHDVRDQFGVNQWLDQNRSPSESACQNGNPPRPNRAYKGQILVGARQWRLPEEYIRQVLETIDVAAE